MNFFDLVICYFILQCITATIITVVIIYCSVHLCSPVSNDDTTTVSQCAEAEGGCQLCCDGRDIQCSVCDE